MIEFRKDKKQRLKLTEGMNNKKIRTYVIAGIFLAYFGLKDLENFNVLYNGIAVAFSITAFALAFIEYRKEKTE